MAPATPRPPSSTTRPWLGQVIDALMAGMDDAAAGRWSQRVHDALTHPGGEAPLAIAHRWHANTVLPMLTRATGRWAGEAGAANELEELRKIHVSRTTVSA